MIVSFKYEPKQHVTVNAFGLNCAGRVIRCLFSVQSGKLYDVEYAINGEIKTGQFWEDDLQERNEP